MITRSPFGAISYNTPDYLMSKLNQLVEEGILQFWYFIKHHKEEDEKKDHIHVYFVPCKQVDTFVLGKFFDEPDPKCPEFPLTTRIGNHSKFVDKFLYDLHDKDYLISKGLERHYHYTVDEIVCSDEDYLFELIHTSDFTKYKKEADFKRAVEKGTSFDELLVNGFIPIPQIFQYKEAYSYLNMFYNRTKDSTVSKQVIDTATGEVLPFIDFDDEGV